MKASETDDRRRIGTGDGGFTLVECALAIVVVAIGIMAAFALIGTGLDSSAKAVAETRAAIFADDVFNGLRSKGILAYDSGEDTAWEQFWERFIDEDTKVTVAAGDMWQLDVDLVTPPGGWLPIPVTNTLRVGHYPYDPTEPPQVVAFTNYSVRIGGLTRVVNSVVRYTLDVELVEEELPVTGTIWTSKVIAVLNVWEGKFGEAPLNRALTFTTEIPNSGGL